MELKEIGKPYPRLNAEDQVCGEAKYTLDIKVPKMLFGKVLRSPYPHAKIIHIDTSRAKKISGVRVVLTGEDTPKIRFGRATPPDELILALDKVRFIGDEVCAVAAISEDIAEEAIDLIKVEYEELPSVFDPEEAMKEGAPKIHDVDKNIAYKINIERGDIEKGFKEADYIFEDKFNTSLVHQCYLESLGSVSLYEPSGKLTIWLASQAPFRLRAGLARALNLKESNIRIVQTYGGGGFGGRSSDLAGFYALGGLLAIRSGMPVKVANTREETFSTTRSRMPENIKLKMGVKKDGTVTAKQTEIIADNGAYTGLSPDVMGNTAVRMDSLYRFEHLKTDAYLVYTNKAPTGAFRGFGNPQMAFAIESMLDIMAEKIGIDPMEIRLKNTRKTGEVTAHGWILKSCGIDECIKRSSDKIGWSKKRKEIRNTRKGIGMACMIHVSGKRGGDYDGSNAIIKIQPDGKALLMTGEVDLGQGASTALAQIAAEELGIPFSEIEVAPVDTDVSPFCLGAFSSRITFIGGNAVKLAASDAKEKLVSIAEEVLEAPKEMLDIRDGRIFVKDLPEKSLSISDISKLTFNKRGGVPIMGIGSFDPDSVPPHEKTKYGNVSSAYTFASHIAEVEVDEETGKVKVLNLIAAHDLGRVVNRLGAEGQVEGGIAQGIGYALTEELIYKNGKTQNQSFLDYRIPTPLDLPLVDSIFVETIDPVGPFGAKGLAEPALVPTAAAIANAIYNATGVRIKELPITPEKVFMALRQR